MHYMRNLLLFISDALRYDYGKKYLSEFPGTFCKGIPQGSGSPSSFPSIMSGLPPSIHGVRRWEDKGITEPTIHDLPEYNTGHFDHPDDPVNRLIGNPPLKQLNELEEPFIYTERELATHTPYGINWHTALEEDGVLVGPSPGNPREYPHYQGHAKEDWDTGHDYIELMYEDKVDFVKDYEKGCEMSVNRFKGHLDYLDSKGILDDTLVIFTADHGEVWGPHDDKPSKWIHNCMCEEVMTVPVLFYDREIDIDGSVRLMDLITFFLDWDKRRQDIEVERENIDYEDDKSQNVEDRLEALGYI